MRARQRHFNARDAGAVLVLDARYIDQADNTAVSTWSDRSRNSYNATQATGSLQPTFQTNELGGQPAVRFDGGDSLVSSLNSSTVLSGNLSYFCLARRRISNTSYPLLIGFSTGGNYRGRALFLFVNNPSYGQNAADVVGSVSITNSVAFIASATKSGSTASVFVNGNSVGSGTPTTSAVTETQFYIGTGGGGGNYFDGDEFSVAVFNAGITASVRKRLEQSAAYSFKIACS